MSISLWYNILVRFLAYLELVSRDDREMWNKLSQNLQPLNQRWSGKWRKSLHTQCNHTIYFLTGFKKNVIELWKTVIRHALLYVSFPPKASFPYINIYNIEIHYSKKKKKSNAWWTDVQSEMVFVLFFVSLDTRNRKFYRQFWKSFACLWRSAQRCGNSSYKKKLECKQK